MISEEVTRLSHAQGDADAQQAMLARIQKYNRQLVLVAKKMTLSCSSCSSSLWCPAPRVRRRTRAASSAASYRT